MILVEDLLNEALGTYKKSDTSFCLMIKPDEESKKKLKEYQDEIDLSEATKILKPDEFHITIRYWPGHADKLDEVIAWLEENKEIFKPMVVKPTKLDIFGQKHDPPEESLVIKVASEELSALFHKVDEALQSLGLPPSTYAIFKPHITLAEGMKQTFPPPDFNLKFVDWILTNKEEKTLWQLSS
jgi:2'-5' RNA ligase